MQDYNYIYAGCMEITVELSCCFHPPADELAGFWERNKNSLIAYLKQVHMGKWYMCTELYLELHGCSIVLRVTCVQYYIESYIGIVLK